VLGLDANVYQLQVPFKNRARRDLGKVLLSISTKRVCVYVLALPYTPGFTCSRPLSSADCCGTLIGCSVRAGRHLRAVESKKKSLVRIYFHTKTRIEAGQSLPPINPLLNNKDNFRRLTTAPSNINMDQSLI
jgi:hypothetical protein